MCTLIDALARYKLNRLHWHLVDDQGWRLASFWLTAAERPPFPHEIAFDLGAEEEVVARGANRTLAVGTGKRSAVGYQSIQVRSVRVRIAQCADRVEALLVAAVPEDVGAA